MGFFVVFFANPKRFYLLNQWRHKGKFMRACWMQVLNAVLVTNRPVQFSLL